MSQAAARVTSAEAPPPRLRLAGATLCAEERFERLRRFRGTPEAFLAELLGLQAQLAGAVAGWAFLPGRSEPAATDGAAGCTEAAAGAADAAAPVAHALPGGEAGVLTAYRLGKADAPTVVLLAAPAAGPVAKLTRERVLLTGPLWDAFARGEAAEALAASAREQAIAAAPAAEASLEAAGLALAAALIENLGPGVLAAAVGWLSRPGGRVRLLGLTPLSDVDPHTQAAAKLTAALVEARAAPLPADDPAARLAAEALGVPAATASAALPADADSATAEPSPVLLVGFDPRRIPEERLLAALASVAASAAPALRTHARADRRFAGRWPEAVAASSRRWLGAGPGAAGHRLAAAALVAGLVFLAAVPVPAAVRAGFTAEAAGAREIAAPFDGELASVEVRPGDRVVAGVTVLGRLATDELRLEVSGLRAERMTHLREADDTRATDPTAARLAALEVARLDAAISLAEHRLSAATLVAPISGAVVSPELDRRVGTPVARGAPLFEVADPADLAATVEVPEAEAHRLRPGARGTLRPASHPGLALPVTVTRIHPVAQPGPAGTTLRVEVSFDAAPAWVRPGSRGSARLEAGSAPLLWQWIRPTVQALRLHL